MKQIGTSGLSAHIGTYGIIYYKIDLIIFHNIRYIVGGGYGSHWRQVCGAM